MMFNLVVTRHQGLVEYLRELGLASDDTEVVSHATADTVEGSHVCGVLPHNLSCLTESFTEIPLELPQELRGKELTKEQVKLFAGKPVTYKVQKLVDFRICQFLSFTIGAIIGLFSAVILSLF